MSLSLSVSVHCTEWLSCSCLISARMLVFDVKYLEESPHCVVIGSPVKAHKFRTPVCLLDALSWECWSVTALFAKIAVWLPRSLFFGRLLQVVGAGVRRRLAGWEFHSCTWKKSGCGMVDRGWKGRLCFLFFFFFFFDYWCSLWINILLMGKHTGWLLSCWRLKAAPSLWLRSIQQYQKV